MGEYSKGSSDGGGRGGFGSPSGCPDVRTGSYDGDGDRDTEDAGRPGGGGDVSPPAGSGTGGQPRHPAER
jgi:hypothetical protein